MPNPIKYTTGSETLALKKGNFYIGTGDVGKGPSDSTGYYNGISPSSGGYVIYMNKSGAPGSLSYHNAPTDSELITFTNNLAGQSYTSVTQCLTYFASQTDKVCLNIDYPAISTNGLVLNLDAGFTPSYPTSGTSWYDLSGNNLNGTLTNGPTYSGGSIVFDGSNDYVSLGNQQSLQFTDSFSAFIWVKPTSEQFQKGVIGNATYNNGGWMIALSNNFFKPIIVINSQTEQAVLGNTTLVSNTWYNIGFTFSSGVLTLYLNGSVDKTGSGLSITKNTTTFLIGQGSQGGWGSFTGLISSSQIYNRVLTSSEISQNYRVGLLKIEGIVTNGLTFYLDAGLKLSYPTTGTTWYDISGNNLSGTLTNGPTFNSANGGSIVFDGSDDYFETNQRAPLTEFQYYDNFTIELWVGNPINSYLFTNRKNSGLQYSGWAIYGQGNTIQCWIGGYPNGYGWRRIYAPINSNGWNHIVYTNTSDYLSQKVYVNGVDVGYNISRDALWESAIIDYSQQPYHVPVIGTSPADNYTQNGGGKIPIARVYNRTLSATEALQNYNAQKGRFGL